MRTHSDCPASIAGASIGLMIARLKQLLSERPVCRVGDNGRIRAAVLVPLYCKNTTYHVLFTQRTNNVSTHKGQISFPGGAYETADRTLADTALRECSEEVGLACDDVEVLGELDDAPTLVSNYVITPYVGVIPWPYRFKMSEMETQEIIEVPISSLLDQNCRSDGTEIVKGDPVAAYFYIYNGKVIWGATARILHQFLDIWQQASGNNGAGIVRENTG